MRLSVIDAGSHTVRLVVADAGDGVPLPVHTAKWKLRLSEQTGADGRIGEAATRQLVKAIRKAARTAERWGAPEPLAFATAVVRHAPDRTHVLRAVRAESGVRLCVLSGETEAELTFLAVRRWMGWKAGPIALFDIGGGSLEVAFGRGRTPDFAVSLPLGAVRLTRRFFGHDDPPSPDEILALRREVRHQLRDAGARIRWENPRTAVASSRTFQQLARLCGAAPGRHGPFAAREVRGKDLRRAIDRLAALPAARRSELPGISAPRAHQSLAGAVIGHTAMKVSGLDTLAVSPWALREGILLRHLEDGPGWWPDAVARPDTRDAPEPPTAPRPSAVVPLR
ncbi:Ppx/GppA family phosphatase [Streptomyces sp. NPDC091377]|uniref:Ppx/GppA phosphatase family protein n=1 Tax=Streptomyces sp. NPDC091377 TaxID=3365995 RepID=UPI0037FEE74E